MPTQKSKDAQEPTAFIIFGVTGDLTRRKLVPALYELAVEKRLPEPFYIIGFARRDWDVKMMAEQLRSGVNEFARSKPIEAKVLDELCSMMHYVRSTFEDEGGYNRLNEKLSELGIANRLFYLAVPPEDYPTIIKQIGKARMCKPEKGWVRIIVEKPYGQDLESAKALDAQVHQVFKESQVYRIDHYLGKETVQNILVFRFANGIFEPLWNRRNVDHVQISVTESVGVGSRAGYYEQAGVIRDVFQNHMLQLLALTAMEAPVAFNAEAVRDEKVKIFRSLRPWRGKDAIANTYRAQYVAGTVDGVRVPGYKDEPGVAANSVTETYLALRLYVDNWRWAGVPFYLRSGKRLPKRSTAISIHFNQVPLPLFGWRNMAGDAPNTLTINIQPDEGMTLTFGAKAPGPINQIQPVKMAFDYEKTFGGEPPEAYERLLLDCMSGDATLFTRTDEVDCAWAFTTEILDSWKKHPVQYLPVYEAGTWGPPGSDNFMHTVGGHKWDIPE
jgi:glucose-6-phosphate 1-dehydrogenase